MSIQHRLSTEVTEIPTSLSLASGTGHARMERIGSSLGEIMGTPNLIFHHNIHLRTSLVGLRVHRIPGLNMLSQQS
jgi:hypothetical protein